MLNLRNILKRLFFKQEETVERLNSFDQIAGLKKQAFVVHVAHAKTYMPTLTETFGKPEIYVDPATLDIVFGKDWIWFVSGNNAVYFQHERDAVMYKMMV